MHSINLDRLPSTETLPDSSRSFVFTPLDQSYAKGAGIDMLLETIEKLVERQKLCCQTYQFKEAAEIKQKVKELKKEVIVRRCKFIETRHQQEVQQLVDAQEEELKNFDEFWSQKIQEYNTEAVELEQQILEKHVEDLEVRKEELIQNLVIKPVKSPKHLEYKHMVKSLAKVEDFIEADKYMKKISEIEKKEFVKAQVQKEKKVNFHLNQLGSQQKVEIGSIKQKISAGRDKLIKIKEDERLKLLQKFKNMMQEIQMAQQLEISKFELKYKSYIPDEKINITAKRREGGKSFCLSDAVFASTNTSFSNWGKSSSDLKEKKSLAQQKKTLLDALCSNALSGKTDRSSTNLKHRRTTSMQNFKV